ncbi:immunoglobulin-binding protein 1 [Panulirus ornatus]|uniref:immunoglobulin-binding protein 1 n=1 Tax=Panulirus ornatus TaxID=150431 RepID=UPI003A89F606
MAEEEYPSISVLFDRYLKLYENVEKSDLPSQSDKLQEQIKEGIEGLVKTTVLVSELGVFSSNETLEEIPTSAIKFLLLPVLLGSLSLKRTDVERLHVLQLANVYFRDFVKRCKQYEFIDTELPSTEDDEDSSDEAEAEKKSLPKASTKQGMPSPEELQAMARQREEKIRRFKKKKDLGNQLMDLKKALDKPSHDEDILRNYYITLVRKFAYESVDELESVAMERKMLSKMKDLKMKGVLSSPEQVSELRPLKPILITKDALQKNVFGLGYPSLPTMTVEEFYDKRVKEGWFPEPRRDKNCLQDRAASDPQAEKEAQECEEEEREKEEEQDDPQKLARDREWDEWRDTHRRGWGNTYNRS